MYEDYTGKDLILATGAPGSRWSGVLRMITANPEINITDETKDRTYDHYNLNPETGKYASRGWHRGAYWGPNHDFGSQFDIIDKLTKEEIVEEFKGPYANWEPGIKIIKSHWFAYHLPFLKEMFPDAKFMSVYRSNEDCFEWWHVCGGWDISYPHYFWYKDDKRMKQQIAIENTYILNFFKDITRCNIMEVFDKLNLPRKLRPMEKFIEIDPKMEEIMVSWPPVNGDYSNTLSSVLDRIKLGIL